MSCSYYIVLLYVVVVLTALRGKPRRGTNLMIGTKLMIGSLWRVTSPSSNTFIRSEPLSFTMFCPLWCKLAGTPLTPFHMSQNKSQGTCIGPVYVVSIVELAIVSNK